MYDVIEQSIDMLNNLKSSNRIFDFSCPICWFGNLDSDKPIILTLSINPSDREFINNHFRGMQGAINSQDLEDAYNNYFRRAPYGWFNYQERILNQLSASYYDNPAMKYQLVHVDLFPFATNPKWNVVKSVLTHNDKNLIIAIGMRILERIIIKYNPKAIISFGELNTKTVTLKNLGFNCVNCPMQVPVQKGARKLGDGEILVNGYKLPVILTSVVAKDINRIPYNQEHVDEIIRRAHALGI